MSRVDLIDTDTSFHRWIDVLWKGLMSDKIYINKHFLAWFNSYHEIYLYGIEKGGGSIRILYNMIGYILNCMENLFMVAGHVYDISCHHSGWWIRKQSQQWLYKNLPISHSMISLITMKKACARYFIGTSLIIILFAICVQNFI